MFAMCGGRIAVVQVTIIQHMIFSWCKHLSIIFLGVVYVASRRTCKYTYHLY